MHITEELLTCAYFESLGFYTRFVSANSNTIDGPFRILEVKNPGSDSRSASHDFSFQLFSADLVKFPALTIILISWPNQIWEASTLKNSKRLTATIKKSLKHLSLGTPENKESAPIILPVPAWPSADSDKKQCTELIRGLGIEGVITFRSILSKLASHPETPLSDHNPIPGTLRMLKAFQLLADPQRDFFSQ